MPSCARRSACSAAGLLAAGCPQPVPVPPGISRVVVDAQRSVREYWVARGRSQQQPAGPFIKDHRHLGHRIHQPPRERLRRPHDPRHNTRLRSSLATSWLPRSADSSPSADGPSPSTAPALTTTMVVNEGPLLVGHTSRVSQMTFSPDSTILATGSCCCRPETSVRPSGRQGRTSRLPGNSAALRPRHHSQ